MGIVCGRHYGKRSSANLPGMWFVFTLKRLFLSEGKLKTQSQWSDYRKHCSDMIDARIDTKCYCVHRQLYCFWFEKWLRNCAYFGANRLLMGDPMPALYCFFIRLLQGETKLHDSEIYISHSITKTLHNDARLSLIGLSSFRKSSCCEHILPSPSAWLWGRVAILQCLGWQLVIYFLS